MSELSREEMRRLARLGAQARLQELKREESAIRQAFPELFRAGTRPVTSDAGRADTAAPARRRRRSTMSAAARQAVSERMRKYWAERRKGAKPAKAPKAAKSAKAEK